MRCSAVNCMNGNKHIKFGKEIHTNQSEQQFSINQRLDYYKKRLELEQNRNDLLERGMLAFGIFAGLISLVGGCRLIVEQAEYFAKKRVKNQKKIQSSLNDVVVREFTYLTNDKTIPTIDTCKSLNASLKEHLIQQVNYLKSDNEIRQKSGAKLSNRLILNGLPGVGKSFYPKILAKSIGAKYKEIKYADINSKWAGEGVEKMQAIFDDIIETASKSPKENFVVCLNEIDSIVQPIESYVNSGRGGHWLTKMEQRSTFLDCIEDLKNKVPNVIIIGTTNISPKTGALDSAAMSRFQEILEVPLPDSNALYEALVYRILDASEEKEFLKNNEKQLRLLAQNMEKEKYSFRDLDNIYESSRRYLLNDLLKEKNTVYSIEHLQKAFKNHGLTDGKIAGVHK